MAEERDPLNLTLKMHVVLLLTGARLYDDALAQLRLVLDIAPRFRPRVQTRKGVVLVLMGRCAEGLAALREGVDDAETAWGAALCGERAEAERMMARIREAREHASEMDLAGVLAALGRNDEAMAQLEESYRLRQEPLLFALEWPYFDPLRSDPRFRDLERRVGIPTTGTP